MNNQFKSLEQGLELLSERTNYSDSLKKNIKECCNVGVIEGFIEGLTAAETAAAAAAETAAAAAAATAAETSATVARNAVDTASITRLRGEYKAGEDDFNAANASYKSQYEKFLQDYSGVTHAVDECQLECMKDTDYVIGPTELGDMTIRTTKTAQKEACKAGCQFNSPQIIVCENTYKDTPAQIAKLNLKCIDSRTGDGTDETTLRSSYDPSGVSAWEGLCDCKLGEKFSPYYITGDKKYANCSDFGIGSDMETACKNGKNTKPNGLYQPPTLTSTDTFETRYTNIAKENKTIEEASKSLLVIIDKLYALDKTIISNKKLNLDDFRGNTVKFDDIKKNITKLSNKRQTDTLNKQVYDTLLLKKSTDLRLYVWAILAIGFGLTALIKIRNL
tara:strand:+ start:11013 stop:12185 length:1173 start_codon:yes stop_codon:yes gene_type:complete